MRRLREADLQMLLAKRQPNRTSPAPVPRPRMNKWEQRYDKHLQVQYQMGLVRHHYFEPFKLFLAKATYYKADFLVVPTDGGLYEIHEVKGFWRDDARVKFKVCAELYRCFQFVAVTLVNGGEWEYERLIP